MKFSRLTYSLGGVFLCYGAVLFTFGPCLTSMAEAFQVPLGRLGLIFTVYAVGLIPSALVNGYLSETAGRRLPLLGIVLLMAVGCALFAAVPSFGLRPSFALALLVMVGIGYAAGGIEVLTNIVITDDNQPAPAVALNITHAFFAVGAVLSPVCVSALLRAGLPWGFAFYGEAALFFVAFLVLLPQRVPRAGGEPFSTREALSMLRVPLMWMLLGMIALYVGAETGVSAWVSPLMEKVLHASREAAGLSVSVLWAFMVVGRVVVTPLSARFRPPPLLFVLALGSAAGAAGVAFSRSVVGCLVASGVTGLFMSGIFALVLADAARHIHHRLGAAFGLIMAGVGLGALVVPAAMGLIADVAGLRAAMLIPSALLLAVAITYLVRRSQ